MLLTKLPGLALAALLSVVGCSAQPLKPPRVNAIEPPKAVLFVGNSFTYHNKGLPYHLRSLLQAAGDGLGKQVEYRSVTKGGAALADHQAALDAALVARRWDLVVLQGHGTEPITGGLDRFRQFARTYDKNIKDAGAKTAFFMTWAYRGRPAMTSALAEEYVNIGNELGDLVVPVGIAFEQAEAGRPELAMLARDGQHPSAAGTYLAACTFYAALYGKSPVGNSYLGELAPADAQYLQRVAADTVAKFYAGGF